MSKVIGWGDGYRVKGPPTTPRPSGAPPPQYPGAMSDKPTNEALEEQFDKIDLMLSNCGHPHIRSMEPMKQAIRDLAAQLEADLQAELEVRRVLSRRIDLLESQLPV